jgi:3-hydroxy-9,10-secoandrosta-1,3,5(10)-triene-9,17-dione monooxygenase
MAHNFMVSQWPDRAQDEVWGADPTALLSGILIPGVGKAKPVEGGYLLSGRWPFVSGVNISDFCMFTAFTPGKDGEEEDRHFLIPRRKIEILDTWYAVGLRGSASNDVQVKDIFVPDYMTTTGEAFRGRSAGDASEPNVFRMPIYAMFGAFIGSSQLGIAERAVEVFVEQARRRVARNTGKAVTEYGTQHVKVAEAVACIKTARTVLYGICDEATEIMNSGRLPTLEERAGFRSSAAFAGQLSLRAVNIVWDASGGGGVYDSNPLSRQFRDISAANRHITQNWDVNATTHGRMVLGLPIDNPVL